MAVFDEELFEASLCSDSTEWTKQILSSLPTCKGVLLLIDAQNRPIQLLQTTNLRRTAQAKLIRNPETSQRKADISDLTTTLFYTCCHTQFELFLIYNRLAHTVFEAHAGDWIRLSKFLMAVIETDAFLPFFYVSKNPCFYEERRVFGLFPTRKAAVQFCDTLNTVFVLCRNPALLNTRREPSCPYLQMQTCPGPCLHPDLRATYSQAVNHACKAAEGYLEPAIQQLQEKMNHASQSMQFERAALFKKHIKLLQQLTGPNFKWVHMLQKLSVLHIDKGFKRKIAGKNKKQQLYRAWKITAECAFRLGDFIPRTPDQVISFLRKTWDRGIQCHNTADKREHLAMLAYFLFRSNSPGLWIDCTRQISEDDLRSGLFDSERNLH